MLSKIVEYKNVRYYVRCDINKRLQGTISFGEYTTTDGYTIGGDMSEFGDNYIDIISNVIKNKVNNEYKEKSKIDNFNNWDGKIKD